MKSSLYKLLATVAMPTLLVGAVGCGGSKKSGGDMAHVTMNNKDMAMQSNCDEVGTFPSAIQGSNTVFSFHETDPSNLPMGADYDDAIQGFKVNDDDDTLYDILVYVAYHASGDPDFSVPLTTMYSSMSDPVKDNPTLQYIFGVTLTQSGISGGTLYGVQSGSVTASALDSTTPTGNIAVTGTNLHFVEWDFDQNTGMDNGPKAGGGCLDVSSFDFSAMYNTSAGGDM